MAKKQNISIFSIGIFGVAVAILGVLVSHVAFASVGNTDIYLCSSINSGSWIWPHELPQRWETLPLGAELRPGQCRYYHNNLGQLRVYIPGASYKYGPNSSSYGACKNAPWDSDPPNSYNGGTLTYKDYHYDNCKN